MSENEKNLDNQMEATEEESIVATSETEEVLELVKAKPSPEVMILEHIREETIKSMVVGMKNIKFNPPKDVSKEEVVAVLASYKTIEVFAPVKEIIGEKDTYLYHSQFMSDTYAHTASMLADKNIIHTIAQTVRYECKTYPRPTRVSALQIYPYFFTEDEILGAVARMQSMEGYHDIHLVAASNGKNCIYSSDILSEKYARALAETLEVEAYAYQ